MAGTRSRTALVVLPAVAALAVGCGGNEKKADKPADTSQGKSDVKSDTGSTSTTGTGSGTPASGTKGDDALGSAPGSFVNSTVQLASLQRTSGDVVTAKFSISVPASSEANFQVSDVLASKEDGFEEGQDKVSGATLIDESGAKRYFVLTDSDGACLCSTHIAGDGFIDQGDTAQLYAKFPAPPGSTKSVSFEVPTFQTIDDVPISDR